MWAHNTHVGDARAIDMAKAGEYNIGQLARERLGHNNTYLIGFGSFRGKVIVATAWGAPMQEMPLPPAQYSSWEEVFNGFYERDRMVIFSEGKDVYERFAAWKGHRAVGVVYNPKFEFGNYVLTKLSERYDAFLYIDTTTALHPLHMKPRLEGPPETYPFAA